MLLRIVIASSLLVSHATAETVKSPSCGPPPAKAKPVKTLRDVDWCNFDVGAWKGSLHEGRNEVHLYADLGQPHDTISTTLRGIVYGDLDGDKRPEAALVIETANWFANGNHSGGSSVQVYRLVGGKPTRLGEIPSGTPVRAITLGKGVVTLTSGPDNATTTQRYRRHKDTFVEIQSTKAPSP